MRYDPTVIEPKWQGVWEDQGAFRTPTEPAELAARPKYYVLDMFPYPSGAGLHVGHPKGYIATDVVARRKRMQGFNVLHPMGWDAFGLPAERARCSENMHPRESSPRRNIDTFRRQLEALGFATTGRARSTPADPDYYRWTQWIFLKLFERGLAYEAEVPVNWCPALGTVLANEEVKDGRYVESGDPVERRLMQQWMLRITAYAERLLEDLDGLDWPEGVKTMQRDWIGKSDGAEITLRRRRTSDASFEVFTTRPDTLFGCTYMVLAPEHPLVDRSPTAPQRARSRAYVAARPRKRSERRAHRRGADGEDRRVHRRVRAASRSPASSAADLDRRLRARELRHRRDHGACPAHDERDYAFATQFGLPIVEVVRRAATVSVQEAAYTGDGTHVNSRLPRRPRRRRRPRRA